MAREFRLSLTVTLPEGDFEEAEAIVQLRPIVATFEETLRLSVKDPVLSYAVVNPKPRTPTDKGDAASQYQQLGGKITA